MKHDPPACHPDRAYYAMSVCRPCYMHGYFIAHPEARAPFNKGAYMRAWRAANPDKLDRYRVERNQRCRTDRDYREQRAVVTRKSLLKWKYGLSRELVERLIEIQDKRCAICRDPIMLAKRDHTVDHDHKTGQARGLLCQHCNRALGGFRDDPVIIERAIDYLLGGGPVGHLKRTGSTAKSALLEKGK